MELEKSFYTNGDIQKILHIKQAKAYQIIQELNKELQEKGYKVKAGVVNAKYFKERYGLE